MNASAPINRRKFLGQTACASLSSISVLSTILHLRMAGQLAADQLAAGDDNKSLVCLFLEGGNDSFNMLVPRGARYSEYSVSRSNLAIAQNRLLPLNSVTTADASEFAVHPSMPEVQELFNGLGGNTNQRRLSFVANIGTLLQPTTLAEYNNGAVPLPKALFSHSDQVDQWHTALPQGTKEFTGWAGRAADLLQSAYNTGKVSMNISLNGNNLLQTGQFISQFVITASGSLSFTGPTDASDPTNPLWIKNRALTNLMELRYTNLLARTFAKTTADSVEAQRVFQTNFDSFDDSSIRPLFPSGSYLADNLIAIIKTIVIRKKLGLRRQTFFTAFGGWDMHFELLNTHRDMLRTLSQCLGAFQKSIEALGLQNDVVLFTASDFGRTLRSNGRGTDHAWGGNQLILGGPIQGGKIFGTFPSLAIDGPQDVGYGGRLLPSTSIDVYIAEMLRWFGITPTQMPMVLPNIHNFINPATEPTPLGLFRS